METLPDYSWRFGQYQRWHPKFSFLYAIEKDGQMMWATVVTFKPEQITIIKK